MAFSVDLASNLPTKDYIVAFGHLKLIRNKNNYGRNRKNPYDIRRKCMAAKVQKNTVCNVSKRNNESSNGEDHISENTAGTSNQTNSETRLEHSGNHEESGEESYVNLKLLRKSNTIEFPTEEPSTSIKAEPNESVIQQRNVQQVQLLNIKPDLCKEVNSPPKSVASARPIPTLGQIYQQDPNDDTTTFGGTNQQFSNMNSNNVTNVSLMTNTSPTKVFKTTNENVSEWLSAELDHPTRDNEFDISLSAQPTIILKTNEASDDSEPVFVLPKTNTDFKEKDYYPDFHKPLMFHSTPVTPKRREPITKSRTASYVEYPSEVLQKTTNFESDGGDNLSSIVETDHGLSSSWMFNRYTDSSTLSGVTWSKLQISQDTLKESFKNSRLWKSDTFDEKRKTGDSEKNSNHDYLHHYCWKKEIARKETNDQTVRNYRERCNKCHKYRQPPKKTNNAVVFGRYPSKSSFREALGGTVKEIRSINTQCSQSLEKDKLSQQLIQNSRLKQAASQDAYTQVFITCNNAATDAIIPDKTSQHSINVMTSTAVLQRLTHNETQVSPAESMWKVSTGILVQELYRDAKSSVVTGNNTNSTETPFDTSVPRRNLDATLVTADGKVLTCTGTKITSVSSADIQAPSILSRTSRQYAVNTATSRVVNQDRSTAPSLHRCDVKDVSLETENIQAKKSEKATSQMILTRYSDIGLSASNIVKHNSINCGSHQLTHSFGAETQPQCYSVITNTDEEPKKPSVQDVDVSSCSCCVTNEDSTQYSSYIKNGSLGGGGCQIGRSRLISVRALFPEATDDGAQAQPSRCSAETKTLSNKKISASMFTSQLGLEQRYHPNEATSDEGKSSALKETKISSRDNKIVSSNKATGPGSKKPSKQSNRSACVNTNSKMNTKKSSKITTSLDASKWIKESVEKHTGKSSLIQATDIETIVKVSEVAVRQSLQRASDIANSAHRTCSKQIHKLSKVLLNSDVNCVTTKTYEISNKSVTTTGSGRKAIAETEKKPCKLLTMDKITSDEVVVRETKASVLQAQTNVRDTATDCLCARRSATALTSRHVLPKKTLCVAGGESNPECLFVYDRPRCVVHNANVDVAVQIQTQKEIIRPKRSHSQHSIAVEAMLPCQVCCYRRHGVAGEALTPKEYKSLYEATRLMMKEGCDSRSSKTSSNSSSFDKTVKYEEAMKMRSQMTSCLDHLPTQCCCMRCTQIAHTDNRSIQAVEDSFLICPKCHIKITDLPKDAPECIEDYVRASLGTSCRYYSNLLAMKLGRVRDNFIKHLAPSVVDSIYPLTVPEYYTEACTMKPSGRMDENCQVKIPVTQMKSIRNMMTTLTSSCVLTPTVSDTDLTAHDKRDLRAVYYILSGIEGRIRRLKNNLHN
ncbi:hypothetical protein KGM_211415 [Danaus plexippus plexippus]|uniref:Uncharacterized protein n=1 Tax=Danaus plexippus plexippus TaxID=278856 RepID=A0A212EZW5_DANPL|nr:hypothetical protein KGM_211415 [Danaus plexippus plexippus]